MARDFYFHRPGRRPGVWPKERVKNGPMRSIDKFAEAGKIVDKDIEAGLFKLTP